MKTQNKSGNAKAIAVNTKKIPVKQSSKQPASAKIPSTPKMKQGGSKKGC